MIYLHSNTMGDSSMKQKTKPIFLIINISQFLTNNINTFSSLEVLPIPDINEIELSLESV